MNEILKQAIHQQRDVLAKLLSISELTVSLN
jgi:hypothetical protein